MNRELKQGRIGHDYSFNYFGGDSYNGKIIAGASIDVLFRCYGHDGNEKLFTEQDDISSILDVRFDRKAGYEIDINPDRMMKICRKYGIKSMDFSPKKYCLYYLDGMLSDELKDGDEETRKNVPDIIEKLGDVPIQSPMYVDRDVFLKFLLDHADDFDISDNVHAQTCSVWIEAAE